MNCFSCLSCKYAVFFCHFQVFDHISKIKKILLKTELFCQLGHRNKLQQFFAVKIQFHQTFSYVSVKKQNKSPSVV